MTTTTPANFIPPNDLRGAGYRALEVRWLGGGYDSPKFGPCVGFDVLDDAPRTSGLYLFSVDRDDQVEIRYLGRTKHLWMVTKGRLPGGDARGGQRYGRPRHAGVTRERVNAALTADAATGLRVRQWVCPLPEVGLGPAEETAIQRWQLRRLGLNRG